MCFSSLSRKYCWHSKMNCAGKWKFQSFKISTLLSALRSAVWRPKSHGHALLCSQSTGEWIKTAIFGVNYCWQMWQGRWMKILPRGRLHYFSERQTWVKHSRPTLMRCSHIAVDLCVEVFTNVTVVVYDVVSLDCMLSQRASIELKFKVTLLSVTNWQSTFSRRFFHLRNSRRSKRKIMNFEGVGYLSGGFVTSDI